MWIFDKGLPRLQTTHDVAEDDENRSPFEPRLAVYLDKLRGKLAEVDRSVNQCSTGETCSCSSRSVVNRLVAATNVLFP